LRTLASTGCSPLQRNSTNSLTQTLLEFQSHDGSERTD
jgi:hypothetical protein